MNKYLFLITVILASCNGVNTNPKEIMETDLAFSALSKEKGMKEAFIQYAAEDVIKPQPNRQPVIGRNALIQSFEGETLNFELTWEPIKAEINGDLGYTFGNWYRKFKNANDQDTVMYGNYVSIWKRQADGSWKYVLDTGNLTDGPTQLK